jgi:hypothetical protein
MKSQVRPGRFEAACYAAALLLMSASLPAPAAQESRSGPDAQRQEGPRRTQEPRAVAPRPPGEQRAARPDGDRRAIVPRPPTNRWLDNGHGHSRYYPRSGIRVPSLPGHAPPIVWRGSNYWFWSGVWYAPGPSGYVVVRPPYGVIVADLPPFRTLVTIGGITYLYLNGVYYRERIEGGYEVVPTPVAALGTASGSPARLYVYPAQGQSAEQQATDEYECHSWAVSQTGFDPTPAATGQGSDMTRRADYARAQTACLEGRGYTVR